MWVSNSFYATGYLYKLDGKCTHDSTQRRPSFDVQFKLLYMVHEWNANNLKDKLDELEAKIYR